MSRKLIKNATIVTMDPIKQIIPKGDILIEGKIIREIAPSIKADDAEIINAEGMIVAPGFVDGHHHNWQSLIKMVCVNWTMSEYVSGIKWALGDSWTPEEIHLSEYIGALSCLDAGTTTMANFAHNTISPEHTDAMIEAMLKSGIRCVFGYSGTNVMWKEMPSVTPYDYADARRAAKKYCSSQDQLLTMAIGGRGPQNVTMDMALEEIALAKDLGIMTWLSVGEGLWCASCPDSVRQLHLKGVVDESIQFTHLNANSPEEFKIIADTGAKVVMCPEVELSMGFGWNSTRKCIDAGILPGISTDTPPSVCSDLFTQMKTTLISVRNQMHLEEIANREISLSMPVNTYDVLNYATMGGARAVNMDRKIGSLTVGKEADIIFINTDSIQMIPMNGAINAIVEYATPADVDTVMVAGNIVKQHGKLVGVDMTALKRKAEKFREDYFKKCNVPYDGLWMPKPYIPDFEI